MTQKLLRKSGDGARSPARAIYIMAVILVFALIAFAAWMQFTFTFWGDQDWELLVAQMLLKGKKLYSDEVAVTPPLLFYLYTLPVVLSEHVRFINDYQALTLLALGAVGIAILASARLMAFHAGFSRASRKLQFILLLCFLLIVRILPPFFADREAIFIVLTLPYLLRWMPGLDDAQPQAKLRLLTGILAAFGFFIKPHCLLVFAAIQLITVARTRSLRILASGENIIIYAFGVLYALFVWRVTPDYLTLILPLAYFTYSAVRGSPGGFYALGLCLLLTFAMLRPIQQSAYRRDIYYFAVLLPFFFLYARINNGWAYSYQPLMTVLLLANGFVLWEFLDRMGTQAGKTPAPMFGLLLCLANFALETGYALDYYAHALGVTCRGDSACPGYYQPFLDIVKKERTPGFGTIGMDFGVWTRVSKLSGAPWVTRFHQLWMLPKLYIADDAFYSAHQGIFTYVAKALAEDLDHNQPGIVFVEVSKTLYTIRLQKPVDWVTDLSSVPAFAQAWQHYRLEDRIDNCSLLQPGEEAVTERPATPGVKLNETNCRYDVYTRTP